MNLQSHPLCWLGIFNKLNKRFKRDSQRAAFLLCVGFCGYGVMRKLGSGVVCPLTGRYA
nr:DUF3265 domain-containing protein [Vibrio metschnikovii]